MLELLQEQNHVVQALIATLFTWFVTALGACTVFFAKSISRRFLDFMLAFAGGVMIAASFWSLLAPAIAMAEAAGGHAWIPAAVGFMLGGFFIRLVDLILPHLHLGPSSALYCPVSLPCILPSSHILSRMRSMPASKYASSRIL